MADTEFSGILQKSELGKNLSPEEMKILLECNEITTFAPGDTIVQQGKESQGMYFIIDGIVFVGAKILGEHITDIETLTSGNFLGVLSFLENGPNTTSAIANSKVICLYMKRVYFEFISAYHQETKYKILREISTQICMRLKAMHDKISTIIMEAELTKRSFIKEVIQSLTKPEHISYKEARISSELLQQLFLFHNFSKQEMEILLDQAVLLRAPENCYLISENETDPTCYVVIFGAVQSSIVQNNKIAKLSVIGPSSLFSSVLCVADRSPFTITFATREPAILLELSKPGLDYLKKNAPLLWYKIFELICKSLVELEKTIDKLDIRLRVEEQQENYV